MTETLLAFFKALADESRLKIIGLLAGGEHTVQGLAEKLDLKEPTVSHHLAVLKAQGLVTVRAVGVQRWHALDTGALESMSRRVLDPRVLSEAEPALGEREGRGSDAHIVRGYLDEAGKLTAIPASRRKRAAVLRWLAALFEEDRDYPEPELNRILLEKHWDSATLRREMVGHQMMRRAAGVYRRMPREDWLDHGQG